MYWLTLNMIDAHAMALNEWERDCSRIIVHNMYTPTIVWAGEHDLRTYYGTFEYNISMYTWTKTQWCIALEMWQHMYLLKDGSTNDGEVIWSSKKDLQQAQEERACSVCAVAALSRRGCVNNTKWAQSMGVTRLHTQVYVCIVCVRESVCVTSLHVDVLILGLPFHN